jgi:hypothetical protein
MTIDPKRCSAPSRALRFHIQSALLFLPGVVVGGALVLYSFFALREILSQQPELGGDVVRFTPPSCPSGTSTTNQMHVTDSGKLFVSFAVTPNPGQSVCDQLEIAIDTPNDKPAPRLEASSGAISVKVDDRTTAIESIQLPVSAPDKRPCPEKDASDDFVSVGERVCRTYIVTSRLAPAANIYIDNLDALFHRTYTKSILSFIVKGNSSPIKLGLPAGFDISSASVRFQNEPQNGQQNLTFTAGSLKGQEVTFFLEDLKRGERKDSALLIYGAILGTGLALVAEALASLLKRLVTS